MKKRIGSAIKQARVPLGRMGYDTPWTMSMVMKRWEQGVDVFTPEAGSSFDVRTPRTQFAFDAMQKLGQQNVEAVSGLGAWAPDPSAEAFMSVERKEIPIEKLRPNIKKPWYKRIFGG